MEKSPFQLAVQVDFIPGGHLQSLAGICGTDCLFPDSVAVLQFGNRLVIPLRPVSAEPSLQSLGCGPAL